MAVRKLTSILTAEVPTGPWTMPHSRSARVAIEPRGCAWQSRGAVGLMKPPEFENVSLLVSKPATTPAIRALLSCLPLRASDSGSLNVLLCGANLQIASQSSCDAFPRRLIRMWTSEELFDRVRWRLEVGGTFGGPGPMSSVLWTVLRSGKTELAHLASKGPAHQAGVHVACLVPFKLNI